MFQAGVGQRDIALSYSSLGHPSPVASMDLWLMLVDSAVERVVDGAGRR